MNKRTRMMLMNYGKNGEHEYMEDKFRDRRGREHYDNGRYSPKSEYEGYMESRQRRDSRGRYMEYGYPMEGKYEGDMDSHYYPSPYVPPIYESDYEQKPVSKIGFAMEGEIHPDYKSDAEYRRMHEMDNMRGGEMTRGAYGGHKMKFSREMAEQWAQGMQNKDGTTGPHWNMEQTKQVMAQRGIDCDPVEFWVAMNSMYADYGRVAKEMNVNNIDFYAKMAEAFVHDVDAMPDKMSRYYEYVVRH